MADGGKKVTWEDIMHLPEETRPEIIGGVPYQKSAVKQGHGVTHSQLVAAVHPATRGGLRNGWLITIDQDVRLSPDAYVRPDLAGWRLCRVVIDADQWPTTQLPDWVCEVLSPTNATHDRTTKMAAYAQAGVPWAWLADPDQKTVEVFELVAGCWTRVGCYGPADTLAMPPFDETVVVVADLFPVLPGAGT